MKRPTAVRARQKLRRELPDVARILRGSLLKRIIRHRQRCRICRQGKGHTVWILTISYKGGRTRQVSIPAEQRKLVEQLLANYRKLRAGLEAICEINLNLLRSGD